MRRETREVVVLVLYVDTVTERKEGDEEGARVRAVLMDGG